MGFHSTSNWQIFASDGRRKYLDAKERDRYLSAAGEEPQRVAAFCLYLFFSGCRVSEALALKGDHIDSSTNSVIIRTMKRRKLAFRQVPLPEWLVELLVSLAPKSEAIWPVHRATAWRWVARVMDRAKISGPMACCRGTRHGFAIHAATTNVPPNLLQRWMGHTSFETTAIYIDAIGNDERLFAQRMWGNNPTNPLPVKPARHRPQPSGCGSP